MESVVEISEIITTPLAKIHTVAVAILIVI